ncbi:hypothetical protein A8C32_09165 [Flavivirga aquatica]|uniref:Secretion system C-terminal sorting domain-containing protein n=1 Tax=Flavivirga aquatica TaxID=1849968 RepID=A0A1E5SJM3_9FLAO|nr:T9SS type A sorting domain-containing protein [Flavivirga aquatica]OEJ99325.1 hypothetical protein A8C32_09165 [Flavivirga aquatica]
MQNVDETPCGNSFSIVIKGITNNNFTIWKVNTAIPNLSTETYCEIEEALYAILEISCSNITTLGYIQSFIDTEKSVLKLSGSTPVFGFLEITFEEERLSTESFFQNNLKFYETKNNPYLQVKNTKNKEFYVEIKSVNGKTLYAKRVLKNNDIDITTLTSGIYFIKVYNPSSGHSKVFKFLKQ